MFNNGESHSNPVAHERDHTSTLVVDDGLIILADVSDQGHFFKKKEGNMLNVKFESKRDSGGTLRIAAEVSAEVNELICWILTADEDDVQPLLDRLSEIKEVA